jgi:hypothetical protein
MWNIQQNRRVVQGSNAAGNSSVYGPSVAEIRNVEVQKNAPTGDVVRDEQPSDTEEKPADEDDQAA